MVDLAKLRWRIERDYQELKQEFGLGHYEGRRWRGFHHHATLCIAAYGFLISERETIPLTTSPARVHQRNYTFQKPKAPRRSRSEPSVTCRIRSVHVGGASRAHWLGGYVDVRAAQSKSRPMRRHDL
ncbi:hypothetical protein ABIB85_008197 [Bradyrhizobium sp. JR1.5]